MLDFLREFQTAAVGLIGFTGVITAQLLNAWLARKAAKSERETRRQNLRTAVLVEFRVILEALKVGTGFKNKPKAGSVAKIGRVHLHIADQIMPKLVELDESDLEAVFGAIAWLTEFHKRMQIISTKTTNETYTVGPEYWDVLISLFEMTAEKVSMAISVLEHNGANEAALHSANA